jgi:hypothetical protein
MDKKDIFTKKINKTEFKVTKLTARSCGKCKKECEYVIIFDMFIDV